MNIQTLGQSVAEALANRRRRLTAYERRNTGFDLGAATILKCEGRVPEGRWLPFVGSHPETIRGWFDAVQAYEDQTGTSVEVTRGPECA